MLYIIGSTSAKAYQVSGPTVVSYSNLYVVCWHVPVNRTRHKLYVYTIMTLYINVCNVNVCYFGMI